MDGFMELLFNTCCSWLLSWLSPLLEFQEKCHCSRLTAHDSPLGFLWGNHLLFNPVTRGLHKCISYCPLQSIEEILLLVSTFPGKFLILYDLCLPLTDPAPVRFFNAHMSMTCRKESCGKHLILTPVWYRFWEVYCPSFKGFTVLLRCFVFDHNNIIRISLTEQHN